MIRTLIVVSAIVTSSVPHLNEPTVQLGVDYLNCLIAGPDGLVRTECLEKLEVYVEALFNATEVEIGPYLHELVSYTGHSFIDLLTLERGEDYTRVLDWLRAAAKRTANPEVREFYEALIADHSLVLEEKTPFFLELDSARVRSVFLVFHSNYLYLAGDQEGRHTVLQHVLSTAPGTYSAAQAESLMNVAPLHKEGRWQEWVEANFAIRDKYPNWRLPPGDGVSTFHESFDWIENLTETDFNEWDSYRTPHPVPTPSE